ncbi:hypothetical protein QNM99_01060, partial [Pseudomonas sp. PCH446]
MTPDELVQEIDNKLLFGSGKVEQPLFQALDDLMGMRPGYGENATPKLTSRSCRRKNRSSPRNRRCTTTCRRRSSCTSRKTRTGAQV